MKTLKLSGKMLVIPFAKDAPFNLSDEIASVVAITSEDAARIQALKAIRWQMVETDSGLVAGLDERTMECVLVESFDKRAQTFDGRDNEAMKLAVYQRDLGVTFQIVRA